MYDKLALTIPKESIEPGAWKQIEDVLSLDCLKRLAIMPDVHAGYDLCIGGVALLDGHVSPSFVGYDIGCGMCHVNTGLFVEELFNDQASRETFLEELRKRVPVGFAQRDNEDEFFGEFTSASGDKGLTQRVRNKVRVQFGTLGGGNHFLEIGVNAKGEVGVTIHSGSRRSGWEIGDWYMKQGRMFRTDSDLGRAYLADMEWALRYALGNRKRMLHYALSYFGFLFSDSLVNENHNYATVNPDGTVLHRKGATPADKGQLGIIPANQRDGVYITVGLGNEKFLSSASHGAGRAMSRGAARKQISVGAFQEQMRGITCRADESTLDETPDAYKPIADVLAAQEGILVDVADHFAPIIVLKG